jgi:hypothetical protein
LPGAAVFCFLAMLIAGLVIRNDSWIYTQIGWLDPWTYVGFGYDYGHPRFDADDYKLGRLPWILAEFYTRHVFDPVASQYFLQLGLLLIQGWFFYLAVARLLGVFPALVGAVFLLTLPFIHGSAGADYNNTLSGPLYCLSFYVLTVAATSSSVAPPLLFGVCFGLLLHSNFLYSNFVAPLSIHFVTLRWRTPTSAPPRSLLVFGALTVAGIAGVTAALCIINWHYGRQLLFFLSLTKMATTYVLDNTHQRFWWQPWSNEWYGHAAYMGVLAAGVISASGLMLLAWLRRGDPSSRLSVISVSSQYLCICAIWVCWQTIGQTALQPSHFAYPLWVPLAAVVSGIAAFFPVLMQSGNVAFIAAISWLACIMPYASHSPIKNPIVSFYGALILYLVIFAGAFLLDAMRTRAGLYVLALLLGPANASVNPDYFHFRTAACTDRRDAELALIDAHKAVASIDPDFSRSVYVWRHPDGDNAISVSSCSLIPERYIDDSLSWSGWHYVDDTQPFKQEISEISVERLRDVIHHDPIIVMVTESSQITDQMRQRFADLGMQFGPTQLVRINQGVVKFSLQILK